MVRDIADGPVKCEFRINHDSYSPCIKASPLLIPVARSADLGGWNPDANLGNFLAYPDFDQSTDRRKWGRTCPHPARDPLFAAERSRCCFVQPANHHIFNAVYSRPPFTNLR